MCPGCGPFDLVGALGRRLGWSQIGHAHLPVPAGATTRTRMTPKDRKSTRLNSSHANISYAVFCLKKKNSTKTYSRYRVSRTIRSCHASAIDKDKRLLTIQLYVLCYESIIMIEVSVYV